jgi:hypothetical protein
MLNKNNPFISDENGNKIKGTITTSIDGKLIGSTKTDGNSLNFSGPADQTSTNVIKTGYKSNSTKKVKAYTKMENGKITPVDASEDELYIDTNGDLYYTFNPVDNLDLSDYYDEDTGEYVFPEDTEINFVLEFVVTDENTGETIVIDISAYYIPYTFVQTGCLALSKTAVRESTHFGTLEVDARLKILCESYNSLGAYIDWQGDRMGNVEIMFNNDYKLTTVLGDTAKIILGTAALTEYPVKIIFTPFKEYAGQKASFLLKIGLDQSVAEMDFDVAVDNLEQCVKVTPEKIEILSDQDSARFTVDASSCSSQKVDIILCDQDSQCSGGTEGGIEVSPMSFSLNPKGSATKQVTVSRQDMAGAYGITVTARAPGTEKTFIDEKLAIVYPTPEENITPDKFVVSLMGGAKDSIRVTNKTLAEEIPIKTTVCNVYQSSLGINANDVDSGLASWASSRAGTSWWEDLYQNSDRYAGAGKYQASLVNTLYAMENLKTTIESNSKAKNSILKQLYLAQKDVDTAMNNLANQSVTVTTANAATQEAISEYNDWGDVDTAVQLTSLISSIGSLVTGFATQCALIHSAELSATTMSTSTCAGGTFATTQGYIAADLKVAGIDCDNGWYIAGTALSTANQMYSLYQQIDALSTQNEEVDAQAALDQSAAADEDLLAARDAADRAMNYMDLAMQAASIDSFTSASSDDDRVIDYLRQAKVQNGYVVQYLNQAKAHHQASSDALTTAIPEDPTTTDQIISYSQALITLTGLVATLFGISPTIAAEIGKAQAEEEYAISVAGGCTGQCDPAGICKLNLAQANSDMTKISAVVGLNGKTASDIGAVSGAVSLMSTGYQTWRALSADYGDELSDSISALSSTIVLENTAKNTAQDCIDDTQDAVDAAEWLRDKEEDSSLGSTYTNTTLGNVTDNINKKRLIGLVSSAMSNGFINGAYEGGVYAYGDVAACSNDVELTLPDYIINLVSDGGNINVSNDGVIANWSYDDPKVYGVFESQDMGVIFSNNGIKSNGAGVVEFQITKHNNPSLAEPTSNFGPFNITDLSSEQQSYKYHFKFYAEPRKGNNQISLQANDCVNGLLRGKTGNTALPKVVMSWDWNSVKGLGNLAGSASQLRGLDYAAVGEGSYNESYLDATQLSILLSKKIGSLANYLDATAATCPENTADKVFAAVRPSILNTETGLDYTGRATDDTSCYLPLTTKLYDGKPALYYYITGTSATEWDYWFSDVEVVNNLDELMNLIDFNVNLIRDGYGVDFQYDFVNSYSTRILTAGPSFLDPNRGSKRYFDDSDKFYYSSAANNLRQNKAWFIPDAGKYRVRLIVDFQDDYAKLFNGSYPSAEIIAQLDLIEPVVTGYSPLYYTPIDGFTGLNANNNRNQYGTSLSSSSSSSTFEVDKTDGVYMNDTQKDSLAKINLTKSEDFFRTNALPSHRSKILDYKYEYNPKLRTDTNSKVYYAPTTATPLLFEIIGTQGVLTSFPYILKKNSFSTTSDLGNMFLLSAVGDCTNLKGNPLSDYYLQTADTKLGDAYGVIFGAADVSGKTYLKTVAYAPLANTYALEEPIIGQIYSADDTNGINNPVPLKGIVSMPNNDLSSSSTPDSLYTVLQGVSRGSICVSSIGNREIFWWPEEKILATEGSSGESINEKASEAEGICDSQS